eukprot:TRINITY_DN9626_c0_g1_i2.p1 TRINITY_DN9626_c0_g1~~TRINITY_DN9626_c0_g1_i2.p1  ORF type:complete len:123 (-),score=17.71 TRINITY_DN9626_c0_g1_i2:316-684(-)
MAHMLPDMEDYCGQRCAKRRELQGDLLVASEEIASLRKEKRAYQSRTDSRIHVAHRDTNEYILEMQRMVTDANADASHEQDLRVKTEAEVTDLKVRLEHLQKQQEDQRRINEDQRRINATLV